MEICLRLDCRSYRPIASNHFTRIFIFIHIHARIIRTMSSPVLLNNRYQVEGRIGSGGMAEVYRARDLMLERVVAVKLLREDFARDPAFRERFRQEAKAAANLSHPNIVTIHDFGFDDQQIFIVMEYIPGTDLKTILESRRGLSVEESLHLMIQACAGVGYAHRAGLVHCDIKPHNMIVTPDQRLKVTDFGIARALASIQKEETSNIVWGSPQYFSPEQAAGRPPSPASDVYGLGVVFYEMLTGRLPFIGSTAAELSNLHRTASPAPPTEFNPHIPPVVEQACLKVLSKEPSARYRTADQFGRVLISISSALKAAPIQDNPVLTAAPGDAGHPIMTPASSTIQTQPVPVVTPRPAPPVDPPAYSPKPLPQTTRRVNPRTSLDIDWGTWALVVLMVISLGGLIPFWVWIYFLYHPIGK
jgi:eukaryotic-like serine/threonine-protein kinase